MSAIGWMDSTSRRRSCVVEVPGHWFCSGTCEKVVSGELHN